MDHLLPPFLHLSAQQYVLLFLFVSISTKTTFSRPLKQICSYVLLGTGFLFLLESAEQNRRFLADQNDKENKSCFRRPIRTIQCKSISLWLIIHRHYSPDLKWHIGVVIHSVSSECLTHCCAALATEALGNIARYLRHRHELLLAKATIIHRVIVILLESCSNYINLRAPIFRFCANPYPTTESGPLLCHKSYTF